VPWLPSFVSQVIGGLSLTCLFSTRCLPFQYLSICRDCSSIAMSTGFTAVSWLISDGWTDTHTHTHTHTCCYAHRYKSVKHVHSHKCTRGLHQAVHTAENICTHTHTHTHTLTHSHSLCFFLVEARE